jgi:iron(III) transport system substrate-binding protein
MGMLAAAGSFAVSALLHAQTPAAHPEIFTYRGADREARLAERARKEGTVVLYTSLAPSESKPLAAAFEKKHGVKVELWRALSDKVVQRSIAEASARRHVVDVIETNGPEMEMLAREKLLAEVYSPHSADLPQNAIPPHRQWLPDRLNFFVVAYNTQKVRRAELPDSYEGFADAKWKGRLGIEATDSEWMATLIKTWGAEKGMAYFRRLAELKPDMRKGHILFAEMIAAGEVPVGLTVYNSNAETLKRKGAPIEWLPIQPVVARSQGIGVARHAPHPHAALLFVDFVLSPEGQRLFESMGRVPASSRVKSALNNFPFTLVEPATVLEEAEKWEKLWGDFFLNK